LHTCPSFFAGASPHSPVALLHGPGRWQSSGAVQLTLAHRFVQTPPSHAPIEQA
jgi:hypothetical protein